MTMLFIPTTWRRNAMNIDIVEIMTSPHPRVWFQSLVKTDEESHFKTKNNRFIELQNEQRSIRCNALPNSYVNFTEFLVILCYNERCKAERLSENSGARAEQTHWKTTLLLIGLLTVNFDRVADSRMDKSTRLTAYPIFYRVAVGE